MLTQISGSNTGRSARIQKPHLPVLHTVLDIHTVSWTPRDAQPTRDLVTYHLSSITKKQRRHALYTITVVIVVSFAR